MATYYGGDTPQKITVPEDIALNYMQQEVLFDIEMTMAIGDPDDMIDDYVAAASKMGVPMNIIRAKIAIGETRYLSKENN